MNHDTSSPLVIWRDTANEIKQKCRHVKRKGRKYLHRTGFGFFNGDIPVFVIMTVDDGSYYGKSLHEKVDNPRGNAYSHRNALRYRKTKRYKVDKLISSKTFY